MGRVAREDAMPKMLLAALLLTAWSPAQAQQPPTEQKGDAPRPHEPEKPGVDDMARDAALQPLVDTNLKKREIPPELQRIEADPYSIDGLRKCAQINAAIVELDGVLGPDIDAAEPMSRGDKRRRAAGEVAKGLVGGLIPFRGLVREISGAGEAQRRYHAAVEAGLIRRAFLKGYAKARRCRLPVMAKAPSDAADKEKSASR